MYFVRFSLACLSALACLGTTYPDRGPLPGGPGSTGTRLSVVICVGADWDTAICGPTGKGEGLPDLAMRAGVVSAPRLDIKCPRKCVGIVAGAVKVRIKAIPSRSPARYEFVRWDEGCKGKAEACNLTIPKNKRARVVAYFSSY